MFVQSKILVVSSRESGPVVMLTMPIAAVLEVRF